MPIRSNPNEPLAFVALRLLLKFLAFLLAPIGWALSPLFRALGKSLAKRDQAQFEQEIRDAMPFLFLDPGAVVRPTEGVPDYLTFSATYVTLSADSLLLRFIRCRGEIIVHLTHSAFPQNWLDLANILLDPSCNPPPSGPIHILTLYQASDHLRIHWPALRDYLTPRPRPTESRITR